MSEMAELEKLTGEARRSLERIQQFDANSLPRTSELGSVLNFSEAVAPASRLIDLYRQLHLDVLEQLPKNVLVQLRQSADADYKLLESILKFEAGSPKPERDSRIAAVRGAYDEAFGRLYPYISYSVRKSTDFGRLEREARAIVQEISDNAAGLTTEIATRLKEAEGALQAIRKVAEEQGVSQQAHYFKLEAEKHENEAKVWLRRTTDLTVALGGYALATFFLHKLPWLTPQNSYETFQLAVSKVLLFATITFFLVLAARSYVAHRHNTVVNRHRQNALATYEALVKAAGEEASRDVVLARAADCIFAAQPTGFGRAEGGEAGSLSLVNVAPGGVRPTVGT